MSVRPILRWPDARLSQPCAPVERVEDVAGLVGDLFETMYAAPGRGLAAPQVGAMLRLFVMDCGWKEGEKTPLAMLNPVIMAAEAETATAEEGCLSIPGLLVPVKRPVAVTVQWQSETGEFHMNDFDGWEARCIQHEMDHLAGTVTLDCVDAEARAALLDAYAA